VYEGGAEGGEGGGAPPLAWAPAGDVPLAFPVGVLVAGDLLIRCRHFAAAAGQPSRERETIFRAAIHTALLPESSEPGILLRMGRAELDVAAGDARFPATGCVDIVFGPRGSAPLSVPLETQREGAGTGGAGPASLHLPPGAPSALVALSSALLAAQEGCAGSDPTGPDPVPFRRPDSAFEAPSSPLMVGIRARRAAAYGARAKAAEAAATAAAAAAVAISAAAALQSARRAADLEAALHADSGSGEHTTAGRAGVVEPAPVATEAVVNPAPAPASVGWGGFAAFGSALTSGLTSLSTAVDALAAETGENGVSLRSIGGSLAREAVALGREAAGLGREVAAGAAGIGREAREALGAVGVAHSASAPATASAVPAVASRQPAESAPATAPHTLVAAEWAELEAMERDLGLPNAAAPRPISVQAAVAGPAPAPAEALPAVPAGAPADEIADLEAFLENL
jgi:hypothetical protein